MVNKNCPTAMTLSDYSLGRLPVPTMAEIERHLSNCVECQTVIDAQDVNSDTLVAELRARAEVNPVENEPNLAQALAAVRKIPQSLPPAAKAAEPPFDPYYTWLGIPTAEQPAHHYRLLGLNVFEGNPTVIDHAADRQMAHVRTFQSGKRAVASQKLLNEIARARVCLLNAEKKATYDSELRQRLASHQAPKATAEASSLLGGPLETVDDLIQVLTACRLATATEMQQFVAHLLSANLPQNARILAEELVRAGRLTPFQSQELLAGRYRQLMIGERELLAVIGAGGMGQVYRARHRRLDRIEAVKVISTKRLDSADAVARFEIEARAAARLAHPNIVATYDAGTLDDVCFIAMEYVDGEDLSRTVKKNGPLSVADAVNSIAQAAQGLAVAHGAGIVHRDIKPHNLLRDRQGRIKILDLGLARLVDSGQRTDDDGLTKSGQIMGTLDYMSPEQALDTRNADARSDLYSLGCTLFFLLTGRAPYLGETSVAKLLAHRETPAPSLPEFRADVPAALDAIFQRTLAKNPEDRFQSAEELVAALAQVDVSGTPSIAPSVTLAAAPGAASNSSWSQLVNSLSVAAMARPRSLQKAPPSARSYPRTSTGFQSFIRRHTRSVVVALGALGICALAGIIYLLQTPQGIVEVELDDGVADTVTIALSRGGKQVDVVDRNDQWKVSLREGTYEVKLSGGDERLEIDKTTVAITQKEKQIVRVSLRSTKRIGLEVTERLENESVQWRFTEIQPSIEWIGATFDDSHWNQGLAPFSGDEKPEKGTWWKSETIWLRRSIVLKPEDIPQLGFWGFHDGSIEIYLNGVLALTIEGDGHLCHRARPEAIAAAQIGENSLAVYCKDTGWAQSIDVHLAAFDVEDRPLQWRHTFEQPGSDWKVNEFDDSRWVTGASPFVGAETPAIGTHWPSSGIWLRRKLGPGKVNVGPIALCVDHDEDAEVYINGVLAAGLSKRGCRLVPISLQSLRELDKKERCISAHCQDSDGRRRIDVEFVRLLPMQERAPVQTFQSDSIYPVKGDTLEPGKWYDVLALVDPVKHAINCLARRDGNNVSLVYGIGQSVVVPVTHHGSYDVKCTFTRHVGNNEFQLAIPVGPFNATSIMVSGWGGGASGLSRIDGREAIARSADEGTVRPGGIVNGQKYELLARVDVDGDDASIAVELDGRSYFNWSGKKATLDSWYWMPLPRADLFGFGSSDMYLTVHSLQLKPRSLPASRWSPGSTIAQTPPDEIKNECVQWNGHWYWLDNASRLRTEAQSVAQRYGGRLLEICSPSEHKFITQQFPNCEIWLGATRSLEDADPRKNWRNGRLEPVTFVGPWGRDQPSAFREEIYLGLRTGGPGEWHDCMWDHRVRACVEWGDERTQNSGDVSPQTVLRKAPSGFRLATNGLGGVQHVDPIIWNKDWIKPGEFAHVKGLGQLAYPRIRESAFAWECTLTFKPNRSTLSHFFGDPVDANIWFPMDVGHVASNPTRINFFIWNWVNDGRRRTGLATFNAHERHTFTLLVNENQYAILNDGKLAHRSYGHSVDAELRLLSDTAGTDCVIHSCQFRPLTAADCAAVGEDKWKVPQRNLALDSAATATRLATQFKDRSANPERGKGFLCATCVTPMTWIAPGSFAMGSVSDSRRHTVRLTQGFWMGTYEVTQKEWQRLRTENPGRHSGSPYLPVEGVGFREALDFCRELTAAESKLNRVPEGYEYRLPTEAEWEYACRAGGDQDFAVPKTEFWWYATSNGRPHEVGESSANAWGLYDMHGNAAEWCLDAVHDYPADKQERIDPFVPPTYIQQRCLVRGGSWRSTQQTSAYERDGHYDIADGFQGFRVVLGPKLTDKIPPQVFDPFAKVEPARLAALPAALPVPPLGQKLEVGKWYDLLGAIDVEKHAINGLWQRQGDGLASYLQTGNRLVVPVKISGNYELSMRFQRLGPPETFAVGLPLPNAYANINYGGWGNAWSGIAKMNGKFLPDHPLTTPWRVARGIDANRVYETTLTVSSTGASAAIATSLDGQPFWKWEGLKSDLDIDEGLVPPRCDVLTIASWQGLHHINDLRIRLTSGSAERLSPQTPAGANTPPEALRDQCVQWNGHYYWHAPTYGSFGDAMKLAAKHNARLLSITSAEEDAFIRRTWPQRGSWLAAWRNRKDPNPKSGWVDQNLQPLKYFGRWGSNQPEGHELSLSVATEWHDATPSATDVSIILEWGEEN